MLHTNAMPAFPTSPLALMALMAVIGTQPATAQTCTRRVDYPMPVIELKDAVVGNCCFDNIRVEALLVVDAALKADLDASVAAGCTQHLSGWGAQGVVATSGYCSALYWLSSELKGRRPSTGREWFVLNWNEQDSLGRSGGRREQAFLHDEAAPIKLSRRARVGDELHLHGVGRVETTCWGDGPGDTALATYQFTGRAPVVTVWLP